MIRIVLWVLLAAVLVSCKKNRSSAETEVALSKCSTVWIKGEDARLCYDSLVNESRCPIGGVCVSAGLANVKMSLHMGGVQYLLRLSTWDNRPYFEVIDTVGYRVQLLEVHPYPNFTSRSEKNRFVKVRISDR
jgi:hypothetical protein